MTEIIFIKLFIINVFNTTSLYNLYVFDIIDPGENSRLYYKPVQRISFNPFLPGGSPKNRQITQKNHNLLSKQQAIATQIPTQFKQKLVTIFI